MPEPGRGENLERFRRDAADWLIACKSLDEGLDIPAVDTVVIAAASKSPRQLIQRLGRALRRKQGDRPAAVVLLEVAGVDDRALEGDALADLREAADQIVELSPGALGDWLATASPPAVEQANPTVLAVAVGSPQVLEAGPVEPRLAASPELPANKDRSVTRGLWNLGRITAVDVRRAVSKGLRSFTGTFGNKSYYDKDSSPD